MRHKHRFQITPGGALLLGALMLLLRTEELLALLAAVLFHEMGHLIALAALGIRVDGVSIAGTGPVILCSGLRTGFDTIVSALSGPALGAVFWFAAASRWPLAAEMSAVLTVVNLLPVLPLDGGRAFAAFCTLAPHGRQLLAAVRYAVLAGLFLLGGICAARGWGIAPLLLAVWIVSVPAAELHTCETAPIDVK